MNDFEFKKKFGQNFLKDINIVKKIVRAANIEGKSLVIEVGPGVGVLTAELAKKAGKVLSFELDERLLPVLDETLKAVQDTMSEIVKMIWEKA